MYMPELTEDDIELLEDTDFENGGETSII